MLEFWLVAFAILVVDVANPVLLAAVILCMSTTRPFLNSVIMIAGHTVSYTLFGLLIIYGLTAVFSDLLAPFMELLNNPQPVDFVISFVLGLVTLWFAIRWRIKPPETSKKTPDTQSGGLLGYFFFGGVINFVGAPFAVPYFSFINQLMRLDEPLVLPNLILYNLLYALPFLMVPLSVAVFGKAVLPLLERINEFVDKYSAYIMPVLLGILGLALLIDAALFFATGSGLI